MIKGVHCQSSYIDKQLESLRVIITRCHFSFPCTVLIIDRFSYVVLMFLESIHISHVVYGHSLLKSTSGNL